MTLSPAMLRLIDVLAAIDVEDYLREQAEAGGRENGPQQNPVLPATDEAA